MSHRAVFMKHQASFMDVIEISPATGFLPKQVFLSYYRDYTTFFIHALEVITIERQLAAATLL